MKNLEEIIAGCKSNDRLSREELFRLYSKVLFGICRRYINDISSAEDVLQDAFIKIFVSIKQYNHKGSFEGWMKRITVNTSLQYLRECRKVRFTDIDCIDKLDESEEVEIDYEISSDELIQLINKLPDGYRTVLNLYLFEEFSHNEIADRLGIKEGTSRSQFAKARKMLIGLINKKKQILNHE